MVQGTFRGCSLASDIGVVLEHTRLSIELAERRTQIMKSRLRLLEMEQERGTIELTIVKVEGIVTDLEERLASMGRESKE